MSITARRVFGVTAHHGLNFSENEMQNLAVIAEVKEVFDHPNPEKAHLGVFVLNTGHTLIGVNNEDGSRRFKVGDWLVHIRPGAIIPETIINNGFENVKNGKVKASKFSGVESEGIALNLASNEHFAHFIEQKYLPSGSFGTYPIELGADVTSYLGITAPETEKSSLN
jgi:tRNA-binding EMAP/Myf-like protein